MSERLWFGPPGTGVFSTGLRISSGDRTNSFALVRSGASCDIGMAGPREISSLDIARVGFLGVVSGIASELVLDRGAAESRLDVPPLDDVPPVWMGVRPCALLYIPLEDDCWSSW